MSEEVNNLREDILLFEHPDFKIFGERDADCPYDDKITDPQMRGYWDVYLKHKDGTIISFDGCNNCGAVTVRQE